MTNGTPNRAAIAAHSAAADHEDDGGGRSIPREVLEDGFSSVVDEAPIENDGRHGVPLQHHERSAEIADGDDGVALVDQEVGDGPPDCAVILDDEERLSFRHASVVRDSSPTRQH